MNTDRQGSIPTSQDAVSSGSRPSRRDMLKFAGQGLALVAFGGLVRVVDMTLAKDGLLRPPGALSEEHFRALCLSCAICEQICPQDVIRPVRLDENLETAGSPCLSFAGNYCNLCMECTQACPTGALQPLPQSQVCIGLAEVLTQRCAAWNGSNCDLCSRMCPLRAIRKDSRGRPVVIPELCVGCGICEHACRLTAGLGFTKGIVVFPLEAGQDGQS